MRTANITAASSFGCQFRHIVGAPMCSRAVAVAGPLTTELAAQTFMRPFSKHFCFRTPTLNYSLFRVLIYTAH